MDILKKYSLAIIFIILEGLSFGLAKSLDYTTFFAIWAFLILMIFLYGTFGLGPVRRSSQSSSFVGAEAEKIYRTKQGEKKLDKSSLRTSLTFLVLFLMNSIGSIIAFQLNV